MNKESKYNEISPEELIDSASGFATDSLRNDSTGIADGKGARLIFLSLRSELYNDESDREKAQDLFMEIIDILADNNHQPDRLFLTGDTGAVRAITLLTEIGLIERDVNIDRILRTHLNKRYFINSIPSVPMPDPDIYGEALAYLSLFKKDEESPERYALQEYLISMTDNCLRLLTDPVFPIYSPDEMRTSLRHSILHFASGIRDNGIFPYKAERIISIIKDYAGNISNETGYLDIHQAILLHLIGNHDAIARHIRHASERTIISDLAQLALFSMIYSRPDLLADGLVATDREILGRGLREATASSKTGMLTSIASGIMYGKILQTHSPVKV